MHQFVISIYILILTEDSTEIFSGVIGLLLGGTLTDTMGFQMSTAVSLITINSEV